MNEHDWNFSGSPDKMLRWLEFATGGRRALSDRKLRLFAVAAARYRFRSTPAWSKTLGEPTACWTNIFRNEAWADNPCARTGLFSTAPTHTMEAKDPFAMARTMCMANQPDEKIMFAHLLRDAFWVHPRRPGTLSWEGGRLRELVSYQERPLSRDELPRRKRRGVVRSFHVQERRRVVAWLTPTVLSLAKVAYDDRWREVHCRACSGEGCSGNYGYLDDPSERCDGSGVRRVEGGEIMSDSLLALSDAIEEAGCDSEVEVPCPLCEGTGSTQVGFGGRHGYGPPARCPGCKGRKTAAEPHPLLAHLRSPGPHYRGCWALDILLHKD